MARQQGAKVDGCDAALLVKHRVDRIHGSGHGRDLQQFIVQRVAVQHSTGCQRMLEQACVVKRGNCIRMRHARRQEFAPAGIPGHKMWLDQTNHNAQISFNQPAVQTYRSAARGFSERDMILIVSGRMVHHAHRAQHPVAADYSRHLRTFVGTVQPCGNQHSYGTGFDAGCQQPVYQHGQNDPIRNRARDVANDNADAARCSCEL